jgi:hypothetical protein
MTGALLATPKAWRRAMPWIPALVKAGRILVGPDGATVRVLDDGNLEFVVTAGQPWHRSIASDPGAVRGAG